MDVFISALKQQVQFAQALGVKGFQQALGVQGVRLASRTATSTAAIQAGVLELALKQHPRSARRLRARSSKRLSKVRY